MVVTLYGKDGCDRCDKAKQHIDSMGFRYDYHSIEYHTNPHKGWKDDGSVEVLAHAQIDSSLPVINIRGEFFNYSSGLKVLKAMRKAV
jgi:glutaredoxin